MKDSSFVRSQTMHCYDELVSLIYDGFDTEFFKIVVMKETLLVPKEVRMAFLTLVERMSTIEAEVEPTATHLWEIHQPLQEELEKFGEEVLRPLFEKD